MSVLGKSFTLSAPWNIKGGLPLIPTETTVYADWNPIIIL